MSDPAAPRVLAVCVVHEVKPDPQGRIGRTAIDKRPAAGPVEVGPLGLTGDTQCDTDVHGGPDQAVYAYAESEAQRWAGELDRPVPPGWFGENLRLDGVPVTDAVIGERWQLGALQAEVTMPRIPCATFARHVDQERWVKRFTARGDVGAYLRVLVPGPVTAGDPVHRIGVPEHGVTVREAFAAITNGPADLDRLRALLAGGDGVAAVLRGELERRLART